MREPPIMFATLRGQSVDGGGEAAVLAGRIPDSADLYQALLFENTQQAQDGLQIRRLYSLSFVCGQVTTEESGRWIRERERNERGK
jgi:hypothetical protein